MLPRYVWESWVLSMNISASLSITYSSLEVGYMKTTSRKPEANIHLFLNFKIKQNKNASDLFFQVIKPDTCRV